LDDLSENVNDALTGLVRILLTRDDLQHTMRNLASIACRTLPACSEASVTLLRDGKLTTPAATGDGALRCDEAQYSELDGPCVEASRDMQTTMSASIPDEQRWEAFREACAREGFHSILSVALTHDDRPLGGINLYSRRPHAYDGPAIDAARHLADFASVVAANAAAYNNAVETARNLESALATRGVIEQAKGIIMARNGCTADLAFGILAMQSQAENRKLREVAAEVVLRTTGPSPGPRPASPAS
jgi:GAF domain-containing protein